MELRKFGNTGLNVSAIGFGAGHIGSPDMNDQEVSVLLNTVLDTGINLIDTARSYGESERRIGDFLSHRRSEFILSTKVGYTYRDKPDWSYEATAGTVDEALLRLKTDYLDIVHLHSCDKWVLEKGDAIAALEEAKIQGKIRFIAYSGENDALDFAIASNRFDCIQCSVNIFDQGSLDRYLPVAKEKGLGIIAKRPVGNAVWRYNTRPEGHGHATYWDRLQQLSFDLHGIGWMEAALRFTAYSPGVNTLITGTSTMEHLLENIRIIEKGPLPVDQYNEIRAEFRKKGHQWDGLI